jgi:hypothetical protein
MPTNEVDHTIDRSKQNIEDFKRRIAQSIAHHVTTNVRFHITEPEDWRALKKYIKKTLDGEIREEFPKPPKRKANIDPENAQDRMIQKQRGYSHVVSHAETGRPFDEDTLLEPETGTDDPDEGPLSDTRAEPSGYIGMAGDHLLTPAEAAETIGIRREIVYRWHRQGKLNLSRDPRDRVALNNTDLEQVQTLALKGRRKKELKRAILSWLIGCKEKTPEHARKIVWRHVGKARSVWEGREASSGGASESPPALGYGSWRGSVDITNFSSAFCAYKEQPRL